MKIIRFLDKNLERYIVTAILVATSVTLVVQVFLRYVMASPLVWAEEFCRYLLVWCTMVGTSLAVKESRHIVVDFAPTVMGKRSIGFFRHLSHIGILLFCAVILYYSVPFIERVRQIGQLSATLSIPMWLVYLALPVGVAGAALRTIQAMYLQFRYGPPQVSDEMEEAF